MCGHGSIGAITGSYRKQVMVEVREPYTVVKNGYSPPGVVTAKCSCKGMEKAKEVSIKKCSGIFCSGKTL